MTFGKFVLNMVTQSDHDASSETTLHTFWLVFVKDPVIKSNKTCLYVPACRKGQNMVGYLL